MEHTGFHMGVYPGKLKTLFDWLRANRWPPRDRAGAVG